MAKKKQSFREAWKKRYDRNEKHIIDILTWDRWKDWDRCTMPDSKAEHYLTLAFNILYSGKSKKYATQYLQYALDCVQRANDENKFLKGRCKDLAPANIAIAVRTQQYALALQGGALSEQVLLESATKFEEWCKKNKWDDMNRGYILSASRMALIVGDRVRAKQLLKFPKSKRQMLPEQDLLKKIASTQCELPIKDRELLAEFDEIFDIVRAPNFHPKYSTDVLMTRFELGVVRYKYFVSKDGTIDWSKAIKQVSR